MHILNNQHKIVIMKSRAHKPNNPWTAIQGIKDPLLMVHKVRVAIQAYFQNNNLASLHVLPQPSQDCWRLFVEALIHTNLLEDARVVVTSRSIVGKSRYLSLPRVRTKFSASSATTGAPNTAVVSRASAVPPDCPRFISPPSVAPLPPLSLPPSVAPPPDRKSTRLNSSHT